MNYQAIIDRYYPDDNELRHILMVHSQSVTARALRIVDAHPELRLDRRFVEEAAMLHDIGIFRCHAPSIACHGTEPYICHGRIGAEGCERHARVCERHTGAGLTTREIVAQGLPLPPMDFLPETMEEKLICYADKFYSKSNLVREKTLAQAERSLAGFGADGLARFQAWERLFE